MRLILFSILCFFFACDARSQSGAGEQSPRIYSFEFEDEPLQRALEDFSTKTGIAVTFKADLVAERRVSCSIQDADAIEALQCILKDTGLTFERLSTGTYKLVPIPPPSTPKNQKHTISGFVRDAASGEDLIGAAVYDRISEAGVATNAYGFYSLTLPGGPVSMAVSYVGYNRAFFDFDLLEDRVLNVELASASLGLDTLVVEASYEDTIEERTQMSIVSIPVEQIQEMPALLGEPDLLRAVQMLPGVQSGNEGMTGLYVRGGSVDQNLYLLDGATIYNPSHLFGFLSVFHARALNDVTLVKGGFPARYGGRLSSVLDISMKEGNMKRFAGQASLGLAASSLTLEGPLRKEQSSFILSVRRSFIDVALQPFSFSSDYPSYALIDFNGKINHRFGARDRIFASVYGGNDRYEQLNRFEGDLQVRNDFNIRWGNTIATTRWNHLFSDRLFSNASFIYSRYHLETSQQDVRLRDTGSELVQERYRLTYDSGVRDLGAKIDFDFIPSPKHYVRFGMQAMHHAFSTGALHLNEGSVDQPRQDTSIVPISEIGTREVSAYLEDDFHIGSALSLNLGLHASGYSVQGTTYSSVQPRLALRLELPFNWALKASYTRMSQYLHLLVNSGIGLPTDLWLPATRRIDPQRSEQLTVGLARTLGDGYEISIEAYDKRMHGLIEYKEGAGFLGANTDWQDNVEIGEGRSYGLEVFLQKRRGRTTGWIGYTLSRSNRTFEKLNNGETFPFKYDRRHDLAITVIHKANERISLSGAWVYGTGNAATISDARFLPSFFPDASGDRLIFSPNDALQRVGSRNGFRMPAYHRLDLGVNFRWPTRWGTHLLTLGAYNTYNRRNPYFLFIEEDPVLNLDGFVEDSQMVLKQASLFPVLPSFSYGIEF